MYIPCPHCGLRNETEFHYGAQAGVGYPDPNVLNDGEWAKYLHIREELRDYTRELMKEAHEKGSPVMRTCFYEFPQDCKAWQVQTQYMYGHKYLVAPVLAAERREMTVYLPAGAKWTQWGGHEIHEGGNDVGVKCPIDSMPVFVRQ